METLSFKVAWLFGGEPREINCSAEDLIKIQDAFFDEFDDGVYLAPMEINKKMTCAFVVAADSALDKSRMKMYESFIQGYFAAKEG